MGGKILINKGLANKKLMLALSVVTLVGVAVAWGLKTFSYVEVSTPVEAETTYGPIKLTMRLNKTAYKLGEPVNINVTVTNISNETIVLGYTMPPELDFWVYNESSQVIYKYHQVYAWGLAIVDVILNPGESFHQYPWYPPLVWDQVEVKFSPYSHIQVPPGTYYITGRTGPRLGYLGPLDQYNRGHYSGRIDIETPKIQIEIT